MTEKIRPFGLDRRLIAEDWLEIQIEGELDLARTGLLRDWLEESLVTNANLSLNLQACQFIDCAAIAEILHTRRRMEEAGQLLYVSRISPAARRIFDITGLLATDLFQEPAKAI
jgi:anti-anti-sigma factor